VVSARAHATETFDAVVIGSGFGGAVSACRLAEAGLEVLVLERGRAYPPGSFPRTPRTLRDTGFWDPDDPGEPRHGLFESWSFDGLAALTAAGLGGGSLIYANVMLRKDPSTFVREDLRDGGHERWPIGYDELAEHYTAAEAVIAPEPYPERHRGLPKTRAVHDALQELGLPVSFPPLAIRFGEGPRRELRGEPENLHGAPRLTCRLCGECDVGCNDGAKSTLDFTYLSRAWRAGARIRTLCEARALRRVPAADGGGYEVGYRQHAAGRDDAPEHLLDPSTAAVGRVRARIVVVAGGTFGSTKLLLANRAALPGLSPALGTRFSSNGDLLSFARDTRREDGDGWRYLDPSAGPVITVMARVPDEDSPSGREHLIQDAGSPAFVEWLWHALELPEDLLHLAPTAWRRTAQRLRGRRDTHLGAELAQALGSARSSAAMLPLLAMGRDTPQGHLRMRGDTLDLDWDKAGSGGYYDALEASCRALAERLGGEFVDRLPLTPLRLITVHPLGGCPMADGWDEGVVDSHGEVFGHRGLFVADGSVMPGAVGANASLTIAAVAERASARMIERARA
jgi:cholesterol oxidase